MNRFIKDMHDHMNRESARSSAVKGAFHEVYANTPAIVKHTAKKFGAKRAEDQRVAIALNKARKAGAKIPQK